MFNLLACVCVCVCVVVHSHRSYACDSQTQSHCLSTLLACALKLVQQYWNIFVLNRHIAIRVRRFGDLFKVLVIHSPKTCKNLNTTINLYVISEDLRSVQMWCNDKETRKFRKILDLQIFNHKIYLTGQTQFFALYKAHTHTKYWYANIIKG
jgi:hypothetical protein